MPRQPNTHGGGANTNVNGLHFEQTTSLNDTLKGVGYTIDGHLVKRNGQPIGLSVPQNNFYKYFLEPNGIDYSKINSKQWRPDEAFVNYNNRTVYIIEKKFQHSSGSVDEKIPNCDFKKKEYIKLVHPLGYNVEFIYILSDWFMADQYRDTLQYVMDVGCYYYYNELPLDVLGL